MPNGPDSGGRETLQRFRLDRPILRTGRPKRALGIAGAVASILGTVGGVLYTLVSGGDLRSLLLTIFSLLFGVTLLLLWYVHGRQIQYYEQLRSVQITQPSEYKAYVLSGEIDPEFFYSAAAKIIGITKDKYSKTVQINHDGSALLTHSMKIRAVSQGIDSIEHRLQLPYNKDEKAGEKVFVDPSEFHLGDRMVRFHRIGDVGGKVVMFRMELEPSLAIGDECDIQPFRTHVPVPKSWGLARADLAPSPHPYDCSSVFSHYPMDEMRVEVIFPPGWKPADCDFDVWCGDARRQHASEKARILKAVGFTRGMKPDGYHMALKVKWPVIGLRYVISWIPPESWP